MQLAGVRIGSDDVTGVIRTYSLLLDVAASPLEGGAARFRLDRGTVDVVPGAPGLRAVRFVAGEDDVAPRANGIDVVLDREDDVPASSNVGVAIDHVVVHTGDPERAIALWRDRVGLRLALDREFPARHLRLLFFRSAGITLEYASPLPANTDPVADDRLYGVSYRVPDLAARR